MPDNIASSASQPSRNGARVTCSVTGRKCPPGDVIPASLVRPALAELIRKDHPEFTDDAFICKEALNAYRMRYVEDALEDDKGEISVLEDEVLKSLQEGELLAENINAAFDRERTVGEKLSDSLTSFGGSWWFIISFALFLAVWIAVNLTVLLGQPFDPYPFILLNLILSCLAAIQAPIIMMSQKRQEAKDRLRSEHDYKINLKAELEIRHLHEKLDHLLLRQWQRLLEIQRLQTEIMQEMAQRTHEAEGDEAGDQGQDAEQT